MLNDNPRMESYSSYDFLAFDYLGVKNKGHNSKEGLFLFKILWHSKYKMDEAKQIRTSG